MRSLARWTPLSGIVFVALWIGSFVAVGGGVDTQNTDAAIRAYYADKAHRVREILAFFLLLAACAFFLWFLSVLSERIARTSADNRTAARLAFGAGLVTTAAWIVAAGLWAVVADTIDESKFFVLDPNVYRLVNGLGYMIFVAGSTITLVLVASTSVAALRARALPRWLGWVGLAVAASLTMAWTFVPFFALLGWVVAVSIAQVWAPTAHAPVRADVQATPATGPT